MKKIIFTIITIFWLGVMSVLFYRSYFAHRTLTDFINFSKIKNQSESYMSVYLGEEKVGYSYTLESEKRTKEGNLQRTATNRTFLRFTIMEIPQEITTHLSYDMDSSYALISFNFELISTLHEFKANGKVNGKVLNVEITSAGKTNQHTFNLPSDRLYLPDALQPVVASRSLKPGSTYKFYCIDPSTFSLDNITIKVKGKERILLSNKTDSIPSIHLESVFKGISSDFWIDEGGEILKEEGPMGITLIKENKEKALSWKPGERSLDLLSRFYIPFEGRIENPRNISYMKLELFLSGGTKSQIQKLATKIADERQKILETTDSSIVFEINSTPDSKNSSSIDESDLTPTPLIQSDDKRINAQAKGIIGREKNKLRVAQKLISWVYSKIHKKITPSIPSALDVLETMEGDCNEHSTLLCALGRASGVPTRICVGLVYSEKEHGFYYHAWNLMNINGIWKAVDSTFGQDIADATHIKLLEGGLDKQVELISIMGKIRLRILDSK